MISLIPSANMKARLAGFGLAVLASLAFIFWIERSTWNEAQRLQREMTAIRTESFYLGVHLRAGVWRLDGRVLRFQLSGAAEEREGFLRESRELSGQIQRMKPFLVTPAEFETLQEVEKAFNTYLAEVAPLLERSIRRVRRDTTEQLAREISEKSATLLMLCDQLVLAQNTAWTEVLAQSNRSITSVIRLMQLSGVLMLVMCAAIMALANRVFITPLRSQLDERTAQLQRQEKLASLGSLATGVAHEIRNPLSAVKFRLFSFKESLASGSPDMEDLQMIGDEINRLERIVKDFLRFARPSEPELAKVSAGELLQEVQDLLCGQFEKQTVKLSIEPADTLWLRADKEQIKQVLINLAQNAAESVQPGGSVTLRAKAGAARLTNASEPVVVLEVADDGQGIPPEVEPRLFDPFFSTKKGGTGLGLPIAARIVEKHGGCIQHQTQRNRGTTFSVVLPRWTDDVTTYSAD